MGSTKNTTYHGVSIRPEKRLAIYLRDGLACCYCGSALEEGTLLSLDHLVPHHDGGTSEATNLVTACHKCNSARGKRGWQEFAGKVASYLNHGSTAESIIAHIATTVQRPLDVPAAKIIMAARKAA